ncbi:MAG: class I SAM-dependent methyltransferase [Desulfohalobiaceae bacterium]
MQALSQRDDYAWMGSLYARIAEPGLGPFHKAIQKAVVDAGCRQVIDLCCGAGQMCRLLQDKGVQCTGVERSRSMISNAIRLSPPELVFVQEDATVTSFASGSFDGVIISLALHEMKQELRLLTLDESARLLKPGGYLFLFDFEVPQSLITRKAHLVISLIERLAGKEHYLASRDFLRRGGLKSLVQSWPGSAVWYQPMLWGALSLTVLQRS